MEAATVEARTPAKRRSRGFSERRLAAFMVGPSLAMIALVAAYPIGYAIWLSLNEYSVRVAGLSRWAGLRNYTDVLSDPAFWEAFRTTFIFTGASVALEVVLGLGMALAMHSAFRGQGLLRTVVLVPWATLTVVTALMWRSIFEAPQGFVNTVLGTETVWLGSEPEALIVMIIADVWKTAPFMALLLIPGDVYEAAKVDGASAWQRFSRITLPLLMPALLVALIFRTLDALRIFDLPFVLTRGAFGTDTLSLISYETFAQDRILGAGSAMAVLTFLIVMAVSLIYIRLVGGNLRGLAED